MVPAGYVCLARETPHGAYNILEREKGVVTSNEQ